MGVLVGTSLIVIIPEGIETLYDAQDSVSHQTRRDMHTRSLPNWQESAMGSAWLIPRAKTDTEALHFPGPVIPEGVNIAPPKTPIEPGAIGALRADAEEEKAAKEDGSAHRGKEERGSPHAWIGVALIAGFILMFLIDKVPHHLNVSKPTRQRYHIALNELGRGAYRSSADEEVEGFLGSQTEAQQTKSFATTIGLVIHAAADGIALGASSSADNSSLSFIIFLAIMVHKAPAAFGLTSILLKQGLSKRAARGHLVLFSLAAPVGALLTWTLTQFVGFGHLGNDETRGWWTGMLLLFSGGTFLYVAMQTMQEVGGSHAEAHMNGQANGYLEGRERQQESSKPEIRDLLAAVLGMILPLFLQIGHAH